MPEIESSEQMSRWRFSDLDIGGVAKALLICAFLVIGGRFVADFWGSVTGLFVFALIYFFHLRH